MSPELYASVVESRVACYRYIKVAFESFALMKLILSLSLILLVKTQLHWQEVYPKCCANLLYIGLFVPISLQ